MREKNIDPLPPIGARTGHHPDWELYAPQLGIKPTTSCVPWPAIESAAQWLWDNTPTNWATPARATLAVLTSEKIDTKKNY